MTRQEIFAEMFGELTVSEKVECFNEFAEHYHTAPINALDEYEFNEYCEGLTPWEIVEKFGDMDTSADYFVEDVYFTTYTESEIEDYIEDYVDQIYNTDRFGTWISDYDLDEKCEDYFTGVIEDKFGEKDEGTLCEFFEGYYDNEAEDEENLKEFETFLKEKEETESE